MDDRKSTFGFVFICNGGPVSWKSSKQEITKDSTTEVECVVTCDATMEVVLMRKFIAELKVVLSVELSISLYYGYNGAIVQAREPKSHQNSKHIKQRFHLI